MAKSIKSVLICASCWRIKVLKHSSRTIVTFYWFIRMPSTCSVKIPLSTNCLWKGKNRRHLLFRWAVTAKTTIICKKTFITLWSSVTMINALYIGTIERAKCKSHMLTCRTFNSQINIEWRIGTVYLITPNEDVLYDSLMKWLRQENSCISGP